MDKTESCNETVLQRPTAVELNAAWPRHRMICGEFFRILSPLEQPERLTETGWQPIDYVGEE